MLRKSLQVTIRKARVEIGLTQLELAERLGVSVQQVNKWENGKAVPELERIELLASVLGKAPLWFLNGAEKSDTVPVPRHYAMLLRDILGQKGMPIPTELTSFQPLLVVSNPDIPDIHPEPPPLPVVSSFDDLQFLETLSIGCNSTETVRQQVGK